jgi:hypothetical protein
MIYISRGHDVFDMTNKKIVSVEGDILNLVFYSKHLFIIYVSTSNLYTVLQYDLVNKKNIKSIEGGHISGPPLYACVYGNDLYISASTNNLIPLKMFDFPSMNIEENKPKKIVYSMFELNKSNKQILTDTINIDADKIKAFQDYGDVDTSPAENSLFRYYVWMFIFVFIISVMILAYLFKENSVFPVILLCILFIAISYAIKNRYMI